MRKPRTRRTKAERKAVFLEEAEKNGWQVSNKAWPDYYCLRLNPTTRETEVMLVATPYRGSRRRVTEQRELMRILVAAGIPCFEITLDGSIIPISSNDFSEKCADTAGGIKGGQ